MSMRVLFIVHHELDVNAGAAGVTWHLASAIREHGHEVTIRSFGDLPKRLPILAKKVLFPIFAQRWARAAERAMVDVVDASTGDLWLWALLSRRRHALMVTRSHGLEHLEHS